MELKVSPTPVAMGPPPTLPIPPTAEHGPTDSCPRGHHFWSAQEPGWPHVIGDTTLENLGLAFHAHRQPSGPRPYSAAPAQA